MSLGREHQEYHLTTQGWIEGTFKKDCGTYDFVETPNNRVLTLHCCDECVFEHGVVKTHFYDEIIWKTNDEEILKQLQEKYGEKPKWSGYKKTT
jgi:hypothetical protein